MARFLKQTSLIALVSLAVLFLLDILYTWALSEQPTFGIRKNEKVDWIIAGDSRSVALRAGYLSQASGKKVLNISSPFFSLENNIDLLEYFFKNGNRVDRVLLQVDQKFGSRRGRKRDFEYRPHIIRQNGLLSPRVPFRYYAENNKNITVTNFLNALKSALSPKNDVKGGVDTSWVKFTYFIDNPKLLQDHSMDEFRTEDLKSLREWLKGKGVKEVVLYSPPYLPEWIKSQADSASFKAKVRGAGFKYHDFSTVYKDTSYFKDHLHIQNRKDFEYCRLVTATVLNQE